MDKQPDFQILHTIANNPEGALGDLQDTVNRSLDEALRL